MAMVHSIGRRECLGRPDPEKVRKNIEDDIKMLNNKQCKDMGHY